MTDVLVNHHYHNGIAYYNNAEYQRAIDAFSEAIAINPASLVCAEVYYWRAKAYFKLDKYNETIADYSNALNHDFKSVNVYKNRAAVYCLVGQYENALADYAALIKIDPNPAAVHYLKAKTHYQFGMQLEMLAGECSDSFRKAIQQFHRALHECAKAIELKPNNKFVYKTMGLTYYNLVNYEKAIECFTAAIKIDVGFAAAYYWRGKSYVGCGKFSKAFRDYRTALEVGVDGGGGGESLIQTIEKDLENLEDIKFTRPEPYFERGNLYYKLGELQEK